jgi:hypothetical protein
MYIVKNEDKNVLLKMYLIPYEGICAIVNYLANSKCDYERIKCDIK